MNQTVPLRFHLAAAMVKTGKKVSGHTKAWYEPDAAVQLGLTRFGRSSREAPAQAELRPTAPGQFIREQFRIKLALFSSYYYDSKYKKYKIVTDLGQAAITATHLLSAAFGLDEATNL